MKEVAPILFADYPDPDVIRVADRYYMITTTMHFFPGGQILQSKDLIRWEHCSYVFDRLDDLPAQSLDGGNIYGKGMWAASIRYHEGLFHVLFICNDTRKSYHFTAEQAEGPWVRHEVQGFYYDNSVLLEDGKAWIVHGNREIHLTEMKPDLSGPVSESADRIIAVDDTPNLGYEGAHLYHLRGKYYIFFINWPRGGLRREVCLRSDAITGPYEKKVILSDDLGFHRMGVAQGGIVETPDHQWYAMLFQDHGAEGRMPVLIPMHWEEDWPVLEPENIGSLLAVPPDERYGSLFGSDPLKGDALRPFWQWNHQPADHLWRIDGQGLHFRTDRLSGRLEDTVNILTQRTFGLSPYAEVTVDASALQEGDFAGLCALQGCYAAVGIMKTGDGFVLCTERRTAGENSDIWHSTEPVSLELSVPCSPVERFRLDFRFEDLRDTVTLSRFVHSAWQPVIRDHQLRYRLDHFTGVRSGLFFRSSLRPGGECTFTDFRC